MIADDDVPDWSYFEEAHLCKKRERNAKEWILNNLKRRIVRETTVVCRNGAAALKPSGELAQKQG